jgi:peptidyl-prolyl cis-trans isomerase C
VKEEKVVARVGDRVITLDQLEQQWKQVSRMNITGISELDRKKELVDRMLGDQIVIVEAYKEGLDSQVENDSDFVKQKERLLLTALYQREIVEKAKVTEPEIRKEYEKMKEEVHAAHILVETEEEADQIYQSLKDGADFAELAREKSIDPSARNNDGDLGFFSWGKMVPEFQEEAFALNPGEISRPVKTSYGWHLIKLIEKREKEQPPFEEAKGQIQSKLENEKRQKTVNQYFAQLRKKEGFTLNQDAYQFLLAQKEEVPPDSLGLKRPGDLIDLEKLTPQEKDMALCTYRDGIITVGQFAEQFNDTPQPYRPRLQEQEKVIESTFGMVVQSILVKVAQKQNIESSPEFKEQWTDLKEKEMVKRMVNEVILKGSDISDQDIEDYYNKNKERFTVEPQVTVREILVQTEEQARDLLQQAKSGSDFANLAKDNTIRTYAKGSGGLLGSFTRSRYPEIFDVAWDMKVGSFGGPIKLRDRQFGEGFSVFKLEGKTEGKVQTLEEVKDRVSSMAKREKDQNTYQTWVQNAKARYQVEIFEDVIKSTVEQKEEEPIDKG